ncbi:MULTISPECIES: NAD(P)/FAD-dependent oxidoreductase [unclassified Paracoccus (in: a-proteobacteria)]|uniref:NAD(P)/FAD-dependent oxidoreductase n=1 Tax=unclassified Paracoccus (in: a-proteobacteria) TaxID=2688777 RepID=UPI0021E17DE7|nr:MULTISPECIES: FAD-binding oxidoreductase [unclassified Paracoccus (in: a-proteobacteria)]UXU75602.1 FAD-binding oxidoreductase [Paracoccus sp. SMMA_5]UXU81506.1 FAD-binding oxidoreductase [Paracoccus sp. SMMA_5_TC]
MASANPGEITVAGAGIFGLACAWELTRRGRRVRVVERARIAAGASGGHVGALAPHAPENWNDKKQVQLQALITAADWWAEVALTGGIDPGYARTGRIQPLPQGARDRIQDRIAAARAHWPDWARMELTDAPDTPLPPESPSGLWLVDRLTARINPRQACAALAAAIRAGGGRIEEGATTEGPAIWATGVAGLAAFGGGGVKGQSALLAHDAATAPQVFAEGLHIVPHADGTVAIGSTSEPGVQDTATDAQIEALIERARRLCPALATATVIDRWAGIRPRARSRAPLVGPWPGRPGDYVANGGFKIGLAMAPACAGMLADLILDGRDRIPAGFRVPG